MSVRDTINKYSSLLKEDNYDKVFSSCSGRERKELLNFLYNVCGIDVLSCMSSVPSKFFAGTDISIISIPSNITTIGANAFEQSHVSTVVMEDSVTSMGTSAFFNCTNLTKVRLSRSLEKIESRTFWGCSGLERIFIPESVTFIGKDAFYGCDDIMIIATKRDMKSPKLRLAGDIEFYKSHLKYKRV